jgi:predicted DCC family thiol-disulfide oxidoreductase YuxK
VTVPVVRFTVGGQDAAATQGLGRAYTVVFDGDCKVCTRLSKVLRNWDRGRELEVVSSQQPGVMARFPWIPARAYADALQLIAADGTTWQGAAAIEQLLTALPRGRLISWVFKVPFVRTLADRFYRWFARNRYRLGCGSHCQSRPADVMWAEAERGG